VVGGTGGVALFLRHLVLQATLAFWTVESLEVMNVLTYGGVRRRNIRSTSTRRVPPSAHLRACRSLCVAYYPVCRHPEAAGPASGAPDWLLPLTPVAGFAFSACPFTRPVSSA